MGPMRTYLFGLVLCALVASPATAQLSSSLTPSARVKVGVLMPRGATKDTFGTQQPGILAEIGGAQSTDGSALTVGFFSDRGAGKTMRTVPVLLTKSAAFASPIPGLNSLYTSSGIGLYLIDADGSGVKSRWGGYIGAGLRLGGMTVEAQYHHVSGSVAGFAPNGVALLLGLKI